MSSRALCEENRRESVWNVTVLDELSQGFRVLRLVGSDGSRQKRPMSVRVGLTFNTFKVLNQIFYRSVQRL